MFRFAVMAAVAILAAFPVLAAEPSSDRPVGIIFDTEYVWRHR